MKLINKIFRQLYRFTRDGLGSIYSNLFMSLSSVITLTITLSLCSMFVLFAYNTDEVTAQIESEIKIFVEFNENTNAEAIKTTIDKIEAMEHVAEVEHYTKEEEYAEFIDDMREDDPELAKFFETSTDENPLVDSLVVSADAVANVGTIATEIGEIKEIGYVDFGEESTLNVFTDMAQGVRNGLGVVIIVLLILAVFLIQNTIRLTIYSRRHELAIMKLVGASSSHIVFPFLIEGITIGLFGALIPILLTVYGYQSLYHSINGELLISMFKLIPPLPFVYSLGTLIVILSVTVSLIGSFIAVIKHAIKI